MTLPSKSFFFWSVVIGVATTIVVVPFVNRVLSKKKNGAA